MTIHSIPLPAAAWYPSNDASSFASARIQLKQSSVAVPSPRYLEWIFDTTAAEYLLCDFIVPQNFVSSPSMRVYYKMTTGAANEVMWGVALSAVTDGDAQDMDADAFASTGATATVTVPGTAGYLDVATISISTADDDGLVAGDHLNLLLFRDPAGPGSDADSDAEFLGADFRYSDS